MAEEANQRIVVIDCDFESPGLPHEPLCREMEANARERDAVQDRIQDNLGFIDLFNELMGRSEDVWQSFLATDLGRYVVLLPGSSGTGALLLVPCGRGSVDATSAYRAALTRFYALLNGSEAASSEVPARKTVRAMQAIMGALAQHFDLDYIFLDARTGYNGFFDVHAISLPHVLMIFTALNDQNISGSLGFLADRSPNVQRQILVQVVLSPMPKAVSELLTQRLGNLRAVLRDIKTEISSIPATSPTAPLFDVSGDIDFVLSYSELAAVAEIYFPAEPVQDVLGESYRAIAASLLSLHTEAAVSSGLSDAIERVDWLASRTLPLKIACEDVARGHFRAFVERECALIGEECRLDKRDEKKGIWRLRQGEGREIVTVKFWALEDPKAPWNCLSPGKWCVDEYDIVTVPARLGYNVTKETFHLLGGVDGTPTNLSPEFLDESYPGWRTWATTEASAGGVAQVGFPFSVNTTLLCYDERVAGRACREYWRSRNAGDGRLFTPSNWSLATTLSSLLGTVGGTAFGLSTTDMGMYYEWASILFSCGGNDVDVHEGGVFGTPHLGERSARDATETFLNLHRLGTSRIDPPVTMSGVQDLFNESKLGGFVGWTDTFRFLREGYRTLCVGHHADEREAQPDGGPVLRLSRLPRDARKPRRALVVVWILTFPKRRPPGERPPFQFVRRFLSREFQASLLSGGFPSASLPIVSAALRESASELIASRKGASGEKIRWLENYHAFLTAAFDALTVGEPEIPDLSGTEMVREVGKYLRTAVQGGMQAEKTVKALGQIVEEQLRRSTQLRRRKSDAQG
jgi:hypothetical protein